MRRSVAVPGLCAVLLLAGCASTVTGSASPAPDLPEVSGGPSSSAAPSGTGGGATSSPGSSGVNERGNTVAAYGDEFTVGSSDGSGSPIATVAVDGITPDVPCTGDLGSYQDPPENGHFVKVAMRVATAAAAESTESFYLSGSDFTFIGADGITFSGSLDTFAAFTCLADGEQLPSGDLGPGQSYAGAVLLDTPQPHGVLVYKPFLADSGVEWGF